MMFDELNDDNFVLYASKYYENPQCSSIDEFYADLTRFKYIKRLVNRFISDGELKERLIMNHIVILFNSFGVVPCKRMILFKFQTREELAIIKPFLIYMNYMANDEVPEITLNQQVVDRLRKL